MPYTPPLSPQEAQDVGDPASTEGSGTWPACANFGFQRFRVQGSGYMANVGALIIRIGFFGPFTVRIMIIRNLNSNIGNYLGFYIRALGLRV